MPARVRVIDRHRNIHIEPLAPLLQLVAVEDVAGIAAAVQDGDAAIAGPVGEDVIDRGAERGQAKPAGHENDVRALRPLDGPARSERAAQARDRARFERAQRLADRAHIAHRVDERALIRRVAADADRGLAHAEGVEHVELPRLEGGPFARQRREFKRHRIVQLARDADGPIKLRYEWIGKRRQAQVSLSHRHRGFAACVWSSRFTRTERTLLIIS